MTDRELDVLYIACEMERRAIMTYRRAQALVTEARLLDLLKRLESDETRHLKYFSGLLGDAPDEDLGEKRVLLSAFAQKAVQSGGVMELAREKALESWENLIQYAIGDEEGAVQAYEGFSRDASDPRVKDMFLLVRDEEKAHVNDLKALQIEWSQVD